MEPLDLDVPFCDLCNTSVPLQDLERGLAVRHQGKTIGACCLPALRQGAQEPAGAGAGAGAGAPAAAAAGKGTGDGRLLPLGIAILAAIAGATIFLDYRLTTVDEHWTQASAELGDSLKSTAEVLQSVSVAMDSVVRRSDFDGIGTRFSALDAANERLSARLDAAGEQAQKAAAAAQEQLRDFERRLPNYGPVLTELRQALQQQASTLAELKAMPRPVEAMPEPAAGPGLPAALQHQVGRLKDEDPATRFEAVDELLRSKDPAVLDHLLPMTKDPDTFVRRLTVEGLRDFKAAPVVDALLVALADPEEIVRDTAWRSLKEITGQKLPFEATAPRDQRARAQQKWQEWWDKNRGSFGS